MESFLTPDRIANSISMDSQFKGYYVLVEGHNDKFVYSKFLNLNLVKVKEAFGCTKVLEVLEKLDERGYVNKIGIIDLDFNNILGIENNREDLFVTDDHDIEYMIFKTVALVDVLNQYCDEDKVKSFESSMKITAREAVLSVGREIGYLKLSNRVNDLGLLFKPSNPDGNYIKYQNLVDSKFRFKSEKELIQQVINYSHNRSDNLKPASEIESSLTSVKNQKLSDSDLVNGHDLSHLLFFLMKKVLKSNNSSLKDWRSVEGSLTLAYDSNDFVKTKLFKSLNDWALSNKLKLFNDRVNTN